MRIILNGTATEVSAATTVADLLGSDPRGRAVAVNGLVVRRERHSETQVSEGDVVEVVTAVPGG